MGWLAGWSYRRPVTITNTQANDLTDYQVLVTVDTASLIAAGKMKDDGGDIRFTDSDGTTLLPYWVEGPINASNTKIWVKVPQIPANGTKTIYLYYGNPNAQSESSIADTFIREIDGAQPVKLALPMDEGSGTTVYDQSGNNNNGTIYGATWTTGRFGNSLSFDGVDDYVSVPHSESLVPQNQVTMEVWVKVPTGVTRRRRLLTKYSEVSPWPGYGLTLNQGGDHGRIAVWVGGNLVYATSDIRDNKWHHVVGLTTGTNTQCYIDGVLEANISERPNLYSTVDFLLGRYTGSGEFFPGLIDEVRIYNRALTAAEISDLYNHYGYTTLQYPGRVLVRKRSDPEPSTTVGNEETGLVIIHQRRMLIMSI